MVLTKPAGPLRSKPGQPANDLNGTSDEATTRDKTVAQALDLYPRFSDTIQPGPEMVFQVVTAAVHEAVSSAGNCRTCRTRLAGPALGSALPDTGPGHCGVHRGAVSTPSLPRRKLSPVVLGLRDVAGARDEAWAAGREWLRRTLQKPISGPWGLRAKPAASLAASTERERNGSTRQSSASAANSQQPPKQCNFGPMTGSSGEVCSGPPPAGVSWQQCPHAASSPSPNHTQGYASSGPSLPCPTSAFCPVVSIVATSQQSLKRWRVSYFEDLRSQNILSSSALCFVPLLCVPQAPLGSLGSVRAVKLHPAFRRDQDQ
jgi:hypothetical protein